VGAIVVSAYSVHIEATAVASGPTGSSPPAPPPPLVAVVVVSSVVPSGCVTLVVVRTCSGPYFVARYCTTVLLSCSSRSPSRTTGTACFGLSAVNQSLLRSAHTGTESTDRPSSAQTQSTLHTRLVGLP
jgi:hypothetical protein